MATSQLQDGNRDVYQHCIGRVHSCLLYLGDLARYKVLYSDEGNDFAESVRYYERAALLLPSSGNAQNQVRNHGIAMAFMEIK